MNTITPVQFKRVATDGSRETLTIVKLDGDEQVFVDILNGWTPYATLVTNGPDPDANFCGIYDLDGEKITRRDRGTWELVAANEVPHTVISTVEPCWALGTTTVECIESEVAADQMALDHADKTA